MSEGEETCVTCSIAILEIEYGKTDCRWICPVEVCVYLDDCNVACPVIE